MKRWREKTTKVEIVEQDPPMGGWVYVYLPRMETEQGAYNCVEADALTRLLLRRMLAKYGVQAVIQMVVEHSYWSGPDDGQTGEVRR